MNMFFKKNGSPTWKRILKILYREPTNNSLFLKGKPGFDSDNHPLAKVLKINKKELGENLSFLNNVRLIKENIIPNEITHIELTKEGFEVALQNEKFEKENKVQVNIAIFTTLLAFTAIWEIIRNVFGREIIVDFGMFIAILFTLVLIILFNIGKIKEL